MNFISKILSLIFIYILSYSELYGQNLVPNGSFELKNFCPTAASQIDACKNWYNPSNNGDGSPDYYHACGVKECSVPKNNNGFQIARTGSAYAGIYGFHHTVVFEYIQIKLSDSLVKGNSYCISFYSNLVDSSSLACNGLGAYVSASKIIQNSWDQIKVIPQIISNNIMSDTSRWELISGSFVAAGGEKYITIGNFAPKSQVIKIRQVPLWDSVAYYNIDDVSLTSVSAGRDTTIIKGASVTLQASNEKSYLWSPSLDLNCNTCQNPITRPMEKTTYYLTVKDDNGCLAKDSITIFVKCNEYLYIPTSFSPNGDGINDTLYVRGSEGCMTNLVFKIYDRWGENIFKTSNILEGWDGSFNSKKLNTNIFVWTLTGSIEKEAVTKKGTFSLIR